MKAAIGTLTGSIILLLVGAVISYYIFRPAPLAFANCNPVRGDATLIVSCDNESNYHKNVIWSFGEKDGRQIKDKDVVLHEYKQSGRYTITLTAYGQGAPSKWTQLIEVLEQVAIDTPIGATIIANVKENRVVTTKTVQISKTKDNHPSTFDDHSQTYTESFSADNGFRIINATFNTTSAARAVDVRQSIASGGSTVQMSYRLTSGPAVDRYRGWLRGNLLLQQEKLEPAQRVTLASNINLTKYGTYALPKNISLDTVETISILGQEDQIIAYGAPSGILASRENKLAFSFEEKAGQLFLKVESKD